MELIFQQTNNEEEETLSLNSAAEIIAFDFPRMPTQKTEHRRHKAPHV